MIGLRTIRGSRTAAVAATTLALGTLTAVYCAIPAAADTGTSTSASTGSSSSSGSSSSTEGTLKGTPCTTGAKVCVDLDKQKAWLSNGTAVTGGPYTIASGGLGRETPPGTFHVINKVQDYKSKQYPLPNGQPAPMPWAVFFEPGGIAFHGGDPNRASSGCIHLDTAVAQNFFNTLKVGDQVQVVQSKDGIKNAFYKAHHLKPPTKEQQAASALAHTNAVRKSQGLPPLPAASTDAKKASTDKPASDKTSDDKTSNDKSSDDKKSDDDK